MEEGHQPGRAGVVAPRDHLHRRDLPARGQAHVLQGRSVEDPSGLFNSSLEGKVRRAIDFHEGEEIDEQAFVALIRAAAALNARD